MKKLVFALLLATPVVAFAQEGEEGRVTHEAAGDSAEAEGPGSEHHTGAAHEVHDPTKHFNFFNFDFRGKDEFGGKYGDGQMVDPHTGAVVKDEHGERAEEEPMSAPFVLMLLNFGVLLLILAKWGGPVARKLAQERHDQIKTALDEAAALRDEAQKKLTELEQKVKNVDVEVKQIVDDIRASAEADKARILETAQTQAAQMKRDAEIRIAAEIEYARKALQKEVSLAAANATEKLLKEKVTSDDQNKLVSTFITNMPSTRKEAR